VFGRAFWNEELPLDQQEIDEIPEYFGVKAVLAIDLGWEKTSYVVHPTPCLVLFLKEFDDDRGEHFGVNHVGLTFERLAAGVWQDVGQRISAMV